MKTIAAREASAQSAPAAQDKFTRPPVGSTSTLTRN